MCDLQYRKDKEELCMSLIRQIITHKTEGTPCVEGTLLEAHLFAPIVERLALAVAGYRYKADKGDTPLEEFEKQVTIEVKALMGNELKDLTLEMLRRTRSN